MSATVPSLDPSDLPDDPAVLKALLVAERSLRAELADEVARLSAIVQAFRRAMFGRRSEKLDPAQLELALEEAEQEFAEARAEKDAVDPTLKVARTTRRRASRGALPTHLPWIEIIVEPESLDCPWLAVARCTGSAKTSPNGSMSPRRSSGCLSPVGPNPPAAAVPKAWCRRRPRRA